MNWEYFIIPFFLFSLFVGAVSHEMDLHRNLIEKNKTTFWFETNYNIIEKTKVEQDD